MILFRTTTGTKFRFPKGTFNPDGLSLSRRILLKKIDADDWTIEFFSDVSEYITVRNSTGHSSLKIPVTGPTSRGMYSTADPQMAALIIGDHARLIKVKTASRIENGRTVEYMYAEPSPFQDFGRVTFSEFETDDEKNAIVQLAILSAKRNGKQGYVMSPNGVQSLTDLISWDHSSFWSNAEGTIVIDMAEMDAVGIH